MAKFFTVEATTINGKDYVQFTPFVTKVAGAMPIARLAAKYDWLAQKLEGGRRHPAGIKSKAGKEYRSMVAMPVAAKAAPVAAPDVDLELEAAKAEVARLRAEQDNAKADRKAKHDAGMPERVKVDKRSKAYLNAWDAAIIENAMVDAERENARRDAMPVAARNGGVTLDGFSTNVKQVIGRLRKMSDADRNAVLANI